MIYLKRFLFGLAVFIFTTVSFAKGTSVLAMPWTFLPEMYDHYYAYGWKVKLKSRDGKSIKPFVIYSDREHYVKYKKGLSSGVYEVFVKMVATGTGEEPGAEYESFGEILINEGEVVIFPYVLGFTTEETEFNTVTHSAYSKYLDFDGRKKYGKKVQKKIKGKKPIRWLNFEEEKVAS